MKESYSDFNFKEDIELMRLNYEMQNKMNHMNLNGESSNTIRSSEAYHQVSKDTNWQS